MHDDGDNDIGCIDPETLPRVSYQLDTVSGREAIGIGGQ